MAYQYCLEPSHSAIESLFTSGRVNRKLYSSLQNSLGQDQRSSRCDEEVDEKPTLGDLREVLFQDGMGELGDVEEASVALDFEGMDFNANDMLWLNSSAADILF